MILLELAKQRGLRPKWVATTAGGEYHSECPNCGGKDRFYIQPNKQMARCLGLYRCRKCETYGDSIQFARDFLGYSYEEAFLAAGGTNTYKKHMPTLLDRNMEPAIPSLKAPLKKWTLNATRFAEHAHILLLRQPKILAQLEKRGLPLKAVQKYKLGWSPIEQYLSREEWGLNAQLKANGKPCSVWIPKGLIIPTLEPSGIVIRLKIRRVAWHEKDHLPKYVAVSGSMNGLTLIGTQKAVVIVVESELDAYAIHHAVSDFASIIACGGCVKNVDVVANLKAKNATHLMICHDNDEAGQKMLRKWQNLYPNAIKYSTPFGKDIGEAMQQGLILRAWIIAGLPHQLQTSFGLCKDNIVIKE